MIGHPSYQSLERGTYLDGSTVVGEQVYIEQLFDPGKGDKGLSGAKKGQIQLDVRSVQHHSLDPVRPSKDERELLVHHVCVLPGKVMF